VVTVATGLYAGYMAEPTSNTVGTRELKARLSEYVSEVQFQNRHIKVTRNGKLAAVLVPVDWYVSASVEHGRPRPEAETEQRRASSESAD